VTDGIVQIVLPAHLVGSVNVWLLRGDPLTLVDSGERFNGTVQALETALAVEGLRIEDVELLALTHNHVDHIGLVEELRERSGAEVAALADVADYGAHYYERTEGERVFSAALLREHGVPDALLGQSDRLFDHMQSHARPFEVTRPLAPGDVLAMGGHDFTIVHRPGHSANDTLYIDDETGLAVGGDHLLAHISSIAEMSPVTAPGDLAPHRRPALLQYLDGLLQTRSMAPGMVLTGHGEAVQDPATLITQRLGFHRSRCEAIASALAAGEQTCFELAGRLWSEETVRSQPLHVVWEVIGHLDVLVDEGRVHSSAGDDGVIRFGLDGTAPGAPPAVQRLDAHL
jgi:glyoxylase-like metal-dependent hydrolase (beta-lactamase superfamily II)